MIVVDDGGGGLVKVRKKPGSVKYMRRRKKRVWRFKQKIRI